MNLFFFCVKNCIFFLYIYHTCYIQLIAMKLWKITVCTAKQIQTKIKSNHFIWIQNTQRTRSINLSELHFFFWCKTNLFLSFWRQLLEHCSPVRPFSITAKQIQTKIKSLHLNSEHATDMVSNSVNSINKQKTRSTPVNFISFLM